MAERTIAVLPGDGVGPEVVESAVAVARAAAARGGIELALREGAIGGAAIDRHGEALPAATLELCSRADAVLLGAVGGPAWDGGEVRPEAGLLGLRRALGVWANVRPIRVHAALADASPLRADLLRDVDILFVRELTGGIYFGPKERSAGRATDLCVYTEDEIARVVRRAATLASGRRGRLTSVDKANVLETSRLWREVAERVVRDEFPLIEIEHVLVDAMAMYLLARPRDFDVVVTENMFGDILTDEASMLAGSLGLLPSASLGDGTRGLYEPVHGSAPDLAGHGTANPIGAISSVALMFRHSLGLPDAAAEIEAAVDRTLADGVRTRDLSGPHTTAEMTSAILAALE